METRAPDDLVAVDQSDVSLPAGQPTSDRDRLAADLYRLEWEADLYATPRGPVTEKYEARANRLIAAQNTRHPFLARGQVYKNKVGATVRLLGPAHYGVDALPAQVIGNLWWAEDGYTFMTRRILITPEGLIEAGYELQETTA